MGFAVMNKREKGLAWVIQEFLLHSRVDFDRAEHPGRRELIAVDLEPLVEVKTLSEDSNSISSY